MDNYKNYQPTNVLSRVFEILPGLLIWLLLLSPLWAGVLFGDVLLNIFVLLSVYWVYRSTILTFGSLIGYHRTKKAKQTNWYQKIESLNKESLPQLELLPRDSNFPKHLIVIANYGEDYEVIYRTIKAICDQNYPKDRIYVSVSIEARKAKKDADYAQRGEYLQRDFGEILGDRIMCFTHPDDIEGEQPGAASNRSWGTKKAVEYLESIGENISEFLVTAPDGDLIFHKEFLGAMSYVWLNAVDRNNRFYQTAMYTFNNNYWDAPILVRILMNSITLPVLASSVFEKQKRETWSCFSLNLKLMKDVNYWDTGISVGADDTTFYWRPYFYLDGKWYSEVFYVPLSADAVYHKSYIQNHKDQYTQFFRWGWGVITVPIALTQFIILKNKKISLFKKIYKIFRLLEVFVFWKAFPFLITFGIPIVLFLNIELNLKITSVTIPETISTLLTTSVVFLIPNTLIKIKIVQPRPKRIGKFKYFLINILEFPLLIVALFTFGTIPFIDASTRMMFGTKEKKVTWSSKELKK